MKVTEVRRIAICCPFLEKKQCGLLLKRAGPDAHFSGNTLSVRRSGRQPGRRHLTRQVGSRTHLSASPSLLPFSFPFSLLFLPLSRRFLPSACRHGRTGHGRATESMAPTTGGPGEHADGGGRRAVAYRACRRRRQWRGTSCTRPSSSANCPRWLLSGGGWWRRWGAPGRTATAGADLPRLTAPAGRLTVAEGAVVRLGLGARVSATGSLSELR